MPFQKFPIEHDNMYKIRDKIFCVLYVLFSQSKIDDENSRKKKIMVVKLAGDKGMFKCFLCVNCIVCDQKLMTKIAKIQIKK